MPPCAIKPFTTAFRAVSLGTGSISCLAAFSLSFIWLYISDNSFEATRVQIAGEAFDGLPALRIGQDALGIYNCPITNLVSEFSQWAHRSSDWMCDFTAIQVDKIFFGHMHAIFTSDSAPRCAHTRVIGRVSRIRWPKV